MRVVNTEDAIGMVLGHDITEIVPGVFKGVAFKKGHIIQESDIDHLLRIGKEHIYILELNEDEIHEDDAALALGNLICGQGVHFTTPPSEGKINIYPSFKGLLKVQRDILDEVNDLEDICIAAIHGDRTINEEDLIGGCRVIPLTIKKDKIDEVKKIIGEMGPIFRVKSFNSLKAAIIVAGSEVYKGRIEDKFGPVVEKKLLEFGTHLFYKTIVADDVEVIKDEILKAKEKGADLIVVTGGMSVDPDDKTPGAIKATGANIVTYGAPVLPGAMLLMAYLDGIPIFGLPGCVMFSARTAFDLLLPRVMAGETIVKRDISRLGYGGQCIKCPVCTFPNCHFGKC